jgi:hypothetical protein
MTVITWFFVMAMIASLAEMASMCADFSTQEATLS